MIKLQVKESIIEIEPIKSNAFLQLAFLLKLGKKRKSYNIKREVLEDALNEFAFYYGILEKAGDLSF